MNTDNAHILERQKRGHDIFQRYTIKADGDFFRVPSSKRGHYKVSLKNQTCDCKDFIIRKIKCKHIWASELHYAKNNRKRLPIPAEAKQPPKRKTYPQANWSAYNQSQVREKSEFLYLLHELTKGIETPIQKTGRTRHNFGDLLFALCYKVYSRFSSRRFMCDLQTALADNYIERLPSYNSLIDAFNLPELTPLLHDLIEASSLPLASIEKDFCVDSTAFATSRFYRWYHAKYKDKRLIDKRDWVKAHVISGAATHVVTGIEVTGRYTADANYLPSLVDKTAVNFSMQEVSADKAYSSEANLEAVLRHGATPYIAFKKNATAGAYHYVGETWKNCFHFYAMNQEKFLENYSKRSNIETVFMMVKTKFGDSVRSKTETALVNESLAKFVCHNICCLITSMHELGLKPKFWDKLK